MAVCVCVWFSLLFYIILGKEFKGPAKTLLKTPWSDDPHKLVISPPMIGWKEADGTQCLGQLVNVSIIFLARKTS